MGSSTSVTISSRSGLIMWSLTTICFSIFMAAAAEKSRQERLFFVSSSSTTSTLSTTTICYATTSTGITACTGRKKRQIVSDQSNAKEDHSDFDKLIQPQRLEQNSEDADVDSLEDDNLVKSGHDDSDYQRDGRFLMYWKTTTSTSTSTSYTATSTLATLECTPSGFSLSLCGKK